MSQKTEQKFFRAKEVIQLLSIGKSTLWRWTKAGKLPAPIKLGRRVTVWERSALEGFIDSCRENRNICWLSSVKSNYRGFANILY